MSRTRIGLSTIVALLALSVVIAPVAVGKGRPLQADLVGANEVPGPGDPDGTGDARLRLNQGRHRICYRIEVSDIALPAVGAHIHAGAAGVAGPIVVELVPPDATGVSERCVTGLERSLVKAIRKDRADYYVNVHTSAFPDGAVRGQLEKWAPGRG